ncbi:MAG: hypothetical protein ACJ77K_03310 [Bacteroidia bacterium]
MAEEIGMIIERHASDDDKSKDIFFPEIEKEKCQMLLVYHATSALHNNKLKEHIVEFLIQRKISQVGDIESYSNSAIYFKSKNYSRAELVRLNDMFIMDMEPFKLKYTGELFWIFNKVEKLEERRDTVSMIGLANETYLNEFKSKVSEIDNQLKIKAVIQKALKDISS